MKFMALVGILCVALAAAQVHGEDGALFSLAWHDISRITLEPVPDRTVSSQIEMKLEKACAFLKFTEANVGRKVSVTLNGHPLMQPVIREKLQSGQFPVTTPSLEAALGLVGRLGETKAKSGPPSEPTP